MDNIKRILSCAGSDSGGGAGIQADIKTISAMGHFAMTAVTAVTAQNTLGVSMAEAVSGELMKSQLDAVFTDLYPDAVKVGMLMNKANVDIIADSFLKYKAKNIVCDTVIMSTSGRQLLDDDGLKAFMERLMPIADIITPNIPEAEKLCGMRIKKIADMEKAASVLSGSTKGAVLIKGGHLERKNVTDVLYCDGKFTYLKAKRSDNLNTHGTGCTLSSAIACGLGEGKSISNAVMSAFLYTHRVISAGLDMGSGNGPMWHF